MNILSHKITTISSSPTVALVQKTNELKAQGIDIISLGAGEPDFHTPINVKNAANIAIENNFTKYTAIDGIPELKEAIIKKLSRDNNLCYTKDEIITSNGGKQVIYNALLATLNPDDEVLICAPYWVSYPEIVKLCGGTPVIINTNNKDMKITVDDIKNHITNKTKWLIINSPSNPSGMVYTKSELLEIATYLENHPNLLILSDDIYEKIIFDDTKFYNIPQISKILKDRTLIVNGVSKAYSMTGWRIGYGAGPKTIINAMKKIQSQTTSNPCSISQKAALEALDNCEASFFQKNNEEFQKKRDLLINLLNEIDGFECYIPQGAFYLFPLCTKFIGKKTKNNFIIANTVDFAQYLLEEARVGIVPGEAFGVQNRIRISYATSKEAIIEACKRIKIAVNNLS